jgi:chorismate lyase / 3-hydroxybenzoate synthase
MLQSYPFLFAGHCSANAYLQAPLQHNVLGLLCFTADDALLQSIKEKSKAPCLHVPMQSLGKSKAVCELWSGSGFLNSGSAGDIHYQYDDNVLFGVMHLSETSFKAVKDKTSLEQLTESAYRQIFALSEHLNFPSIFRFWNYIADINADSDGLERYRQFNLGRHAAFVACQRDVVGNVPVACALGFKQHAHVSLAIAFLAGRAQPVTIENPRQISAYQYPNQYGPVSPTFSRASLVKLERSELLLISGTASIVGHATQHASDVVIQAREAMINIEAILEQANANATNVMFSLASLHYRVYVRYPVHLVEIQEELIRYIGGSPNLEYFVADICRQDLLLEIEASAEQLFTLVSEVKDKS